MVRPRFRFAALLLAVGCGGSDAAVTAGDGPTPGNGSSLDARAPFDASTYEWRGLIYLEAGGAPSGAPGDAPASADAASSDGPGPQERPAPPPQGSDGCKAAGACDPFLAASCDTDGVCVPRDGVAETVCLRANAAKAEGEPCASLTECAPGLLCVGAPPRCIRMCPQGSRGFCGEGRRCHGLVIGGQGCVQLCAPVPPSCDIYAQNCSSSSEACGLVLDLETRAYYTGCTAAGTLREGEACGGSGACAKGHICIHVSGEPAPTCRQVCRPDGSPSCAAPKSCTGNGPLGLQFCH